MNYAFQVSQSSYGTTEESAFKKRWTYRPKSNQIRPNRSQPKRLTPNVPQDEQWEPLCGWSSPEETNIDLLDIEGWIKKSQHSKKDTEHSPVEQFLYSVLVTCPSIYDFDEFREASFAASSHLAHDEEVDVGPGVDETTQTELESSITSNQLNKIKSERIDVESLQSASTISCKSHSSGEIKNSEKGTQVEEKEGAVLVNGQRSEVADDERTSREEDDLIEVEKESKISKSHSKSNLKSKSASTVRQLDKPKVERRISSAQSDPKGASGDGVKQSALRKSSSKKSVPKKVTLNPAPIEISFTENGLFEVTSPTRGDEDPSSLENQEYGGDEDEGETSHRISLRTPDRKAWEQSLRQQVGFELPVLSSLSVGDLLSSTPRLEQHVDSANSKLTFIQALYDKASVQPDTSSVDKNLRENGDQSSFSNLPSLNRDGSPSNLVSSPGTERRSRQTRAIGQDDPTQGSAPSLANGNRQSPSPNCDNGGLRLEGGRRGSKGDNPDQRVIQKKKVANAAGSQSDSVKNRQNFGKMPSAKQQRGPPGFRPPSNKTPLQRAMENAHKKIYGEHHYLFSQQNIPNGQVDHSSNSKEARLRQTKSARTTPQVNNAYMWKERLDHGIKQQRSIPSHAHSVSLSHRCSIVCNHCTKLQLDDYGPSQLAPLHPLFELHQTVGEIDGGTESAKLVARLSSSPANQTIDPSVQILSKVESRHSQLQKSYSDLFRLARQKKLQLRKGGDKLYTLSDFQAPLEKTNVLRTQRGKVSQR